MWTGALHLPECSQARLVLCPRVPIRHPQGATEGKSNGSDEVPECNVPSQDLECRQVPFSLCLEHVQCTADDEPAAADDLRDPVRPIEGTLRTQVVIDTWQCCKPGNTKDGGPKQLRCAS